MSLGKDFARRRMMTALKKEPKYVWAVYDCVYGLDESSATSGTATIRGTRTKMASDSYTVSSSGFTLTNPTSTQVSSLAGKYIVDISINSNTSTSGTYIYHVDSVSSSGTNRTVTYTRYSSGLIKGDTELYRVESDTMDYPVNGEQDGYWYVLLKGEKSMYVWNVYEKLTQYQEKTTDNNYFGPSSWPVRLLYSSSYSFDASTGEYTLIKGTDKSFIENDFNMQLGAPNVLSRKYYQTYNSRNSSWNTDGMYYDYTDADYTNHIWYAKKYSSESATIKGASTGTTVESESSTAYPQNNYRGDYWYIYSHSYTYAFDNR